jgi:glycosyltransferase involved in cell wall biosynthesis
LKILLATSRYPWPPRRGDQMRAVQMLDALSGKGTDTHELTLLAPAPAADQPSPPSDAPYRVELYRPRRAAVFSGLARAALRRLPLQSALFYQPDLGRRLRELAPRHDLGVLQLVRLALHVEDFGGTPIVTDLIDSLALNFARRAEVDRPWLSPLLRAEAGRLAAAERRLAERSLRVLVVCDRDRQAIAGRLPPALASRIMVVPIAIDGGEGTTLQRSREAPMLAITGNLGYFVNADAVGWWLRDVWPRLRAARPEVRLVIAGDRPSTGLRRRVEEAGATLIASPPDLRAVLAEATLALAPMRCGSGVPIKVLEAWSVGVPVVASPWAAAGTSCVPGEDLALAGPHPDAWVAAVTALLDDPAARARLVANGRRRLAADYSREAVQRSWRDAVRRVL